jgi:hypothetical protein
MEINGEAENLPKLGTRSRAVRVQVANGSKILPLGDGRSAQARRFRDVVAAIAEDLGGIDRLSESQRQLVRRAAMLCVSAEMEEAKAAHDFESFNPAEYGMLSDRVARIFGRLGIVKFAREVNASAPEVASASRVTSHFRRKPRSEVLPP